MITALSVAENILHHPAYVRSVSVKPGEVTKSGLFSKRKASEPALVFTFKGNDSQDHNQDNLTSLASSLAVKSPDQSFGEDEGYPHNIHNPNTLALHQMHDKMESGSVASYRSAGAATHVSSTQEILEKKMEKKKKDFSLSLQWFCPFVMVSLS